VVSFEFVITFSLRSDSLSGLEMALGGGRATVESDILACDQIVLAPMAIDQYKELNWHT
jgi:hypothetical protein